MTKGDMTNGNKVDVTTIERKKLIKINTRKTRKSVITLPPMESDLPPFLFLEWSVISRAIHACSHPNKYSPYSKSKALTNSLPIITHHMDSRELNGTPQNLLKIFIYTFDVFHCNK